ncbi:MAG: TRAP transporter large permease subunit [Roseitalea sp.]|jgi:TRAP-type mannitol/chloroaromatic compound transport system permease large subunit|uniref:TRAP transporter large permease n=1 Tax=Oceaniradius stylonematis TaxID=2184161 RepID=UPI001B1D10E6|nr:TRAP transporter large permease subunit [Oceaniradius stylonematis]MBO6551908.1 TRAP transporter large permease subunit [Roseitalea sp.]MBO6951712.1 TRAP transporter large permease subunit [Rhizobiaceae bacterium]MBO6592442.1 TRAP transporter large permease subunit [Roseitalea sp.]MBO6598697.1 TRAP transporter large permease subunit [Roseitalea sp.]MBO6611143.1 TRAP transporter large permease subunit [Roseitalea sp.]
MIEIIAHNLAPVMFITVMAMLLIGYPVGFTLAAGGLIFFFLAVELSIFAPGEITLSPTFLGLHANRTFDIMRNEVLLAIPFFTFMGLILERSRMAEDLLDTIGQLFGPLRGGLAFAVIIVGGLLGATTGVVAASVIAMGLISLPIMMRYGYNRPVATGTIAAAGTLAQIVPPSLVLIVMSDQLGRSVGDMYVGALYPALMIMGMYCAYIFVLTLVQPKWVPALPPETRTLGGGILSLFAIIAISVVIHYAGMNFLYAGMSYENRFVSSATTATLFALGVSLINRRFKLGLVSRLTEQVIIVLIPPLALIFLVLGTIFLGIATPTEGGAMGATGALVLALLKGRLNLKTLKEALDSTTKLTAFVMFILIGARVFALTFYGINGKIWVEELLLSLPGGETGFLVVVTVIVFILGCFLDFFEIAFVVVPLLVGPAETLGIDLIWLGIILGINLQTSFLTPPFGFALFYLRSIAPRQDWDDEVTGERIKGIETMQIYRGVIPYIAIQFVAIMVVIFFPRIVTHYNDDAPVIDIDNVTIELPSLGGQDAEGNAVGLPGIGGSGMPSAPNFGNEGGSGLPGLQLTPLGGPPSLGGDDGAASGGDSDAPAPAFGLPPLDLNATPPPTDQ